MLTYADVRCALHSRRAEAVEADAARSKAEASASLRSSSLELSHAQAALDAAVTELASTRASAKDAVVQVFFPPLSFCSSFFFCSSTLSGNFCRGKRVLSCGLDAGSHTDCCHRMPVPATGGLSAGSCQQVLVSRFLSAGS